MTELEVQQLLDKLTLEQKVGQLVQLKADAFGTVGNSVVTGPVQELGIRKDFNIYHTGSTLNLLNAVKIKETQQDYLRQADHGIPLLFFADVIYGFATIFPIPLAQACSWNFAAIEAAAQIAAEEMSAAGIHGTFAPMVDLVRDPRWGRVMESPGESPLLCCLYAKHVVRGLQGAGAQGAVPSGHVAACIKHFAAYGAPEGGLEYNTVDMSMGRFYGEYLPGYRAGIDAGARLVMTAFNTLNGQPCTGSHWLNREVLREQCGFDGVLVSDHSAIQELIGHGVAQDHKQAAQLAFTAGCDIDMMTSCYANELPELVQNGEISAALLDEAVLRVLYLKNDLGLFEDPLRGLDVEQYQTKLLTDKAKQAAMELCEQSAVLLQNNNAVLPIAQGKRIAVIGPYAQSQHTIGMWAISGQTRNTVTLYDGLVQVYGSDCVTAAQGSRYLDDHTQFGELAAYIKQAEGPVALDDETLLQQALDTARGADVVVLAVGEHTMQSGEGGSRTSLVLPTLQQRLVDAIVELGKPVALVLYTGRPLVLTELLPKVDAVLCAWFPGSMGGRALANLLSGAANPSGRLSMSFPRSVGQVPIHHAQLPTGRTPPANAPKSRFRTHYLDEESTPLFPFGFGLSYTSVAYEQLELSQDHIGAGGCLTATVTLRNIGDRAAWETVQVYLHDEVATISRPRIELKTFERVWLEVGERRKLRIPITYDMLYFYDEKTGPVTQAGYHTVHVGPNAGELALNARFYCDDAQRKEK